jgi:hypothetical protein
VIPEILLMLPTVAYLAAILLGLDGPEDEFIIPYLVAQFAGTAQYVYAIHLRFKYHDGSRR